MKLYIMRHGQTDYNKAHLLQGRLDIPLNADGIQQAEKAAERLKEVGIRFDRVICSPLERAVQTAEIVSGIDRADFTLDDRLIEVAFGPYEGAKVEELEGDIIKFFIDPENYQAPEGAESYDDMFKRAGSFLDEMAKADPDESILVLAHGAIIHAMYYLLKDTELKTLWKLALGNCGYIIVSSDDGRPYIAEEHFIKENVSIPTNFR